MLPQLLGFVRKARRCNAGRPPRLPRKRRAIVHGAPRPPPANWARPERPFIVEVLTPAEAEILVPWGALEFARGTRVKVMTRPLCGSNFQDSTCTYAEVDAGALAATLRTGRGDGPQAQLRLMRFRKADPDGRLAWGNYTGDLLAFWQRRTTAGAGELAASLYNRTLKNPQVAAALARVGVLNPATGQTKDYQHARYSALWVASAGSRTPMHFDPWPSLLLQLQVEGGVQGFEDFSTKAASSFSSSQPTSRWKFCWREQF